MDIKCYLAMTAAEYESASDIPKNVAWMACHFSSYGTGISNHPQSLPAGSMLILNDRIPPHKHDPKKIADQLNRIIEENLCEYVLLDFQQKYNNETQDIAAWLWENLSVTTGVSEAYAAGLDSPVFLSAPPLRTSLSETLSKWTERKLWLEAATDAETILISADAAKIEPSRKDIASPYYNNDALHCKYVIESTKETARITVHRNLDNLSQLLADATKTGIELFIGLYQQLSDFSFLSNK